MTVKAAGVDVPPPGEGLKTVRLTEPPVSRSVAGMLALSWVALTRAVVRELPFQRTTELATKLEPVTVSVNAAPPAVALFGLREVIEGVGEPFTLQEVSWVAASRVPVKVPAVELVE